MNRSRLGLRAPRRVIRRALSLSLSLPRLGPSNYIRVRRRRHNTHACRIGSVSPPPPLSLYFISVSLPLSLHPPPPSSSISLYLSLSLSHTLPPPPPSLPVRPSAPQHTHCRGPAGQGRLRGAHWQQVRGPDRRRILFARVAPAGRRTIFSSRSGGGVGGGAAAFDFSVHFPPPGRRL